MEYLRQLKGFLREQPALGDGSEEMSIREALLSLEKHVTHYCRKHQIKSPPPDSKVHEYWNSQKFNSTYMPPVHIVYII